MVRALLFDHDGTIVKSESLKAKAWRMVLETFSVQGGDAWYMARIGRTGIHIAMEAVETFSLPILPEDLSARKNSIYKEIAERETLPTPGVVDFIKRLAAAGMTLAVVSSQFEKPIRMQLRMIGVEEYFFLIVSGDDVPEGKSSGRIYTLAAERLGLPVADCLAIEDSAQGVASAKAAGIRCLGYHNPESGPQDLSAAYQIVGDYSVLSVDMIRFF